MSFKLVNIWNPKGGQGKSMIAINLAAAAMEIKLKPLVICQDPQGTSTLYHKGGNLHFDVVSKIPDSKPDANLVIIDHQASDWEVPKGKIILMPVKPARSQYKTYADAKKRAERQGKQVITVVTDANHQRADEMATARKLVAKGAYEIPASGVFSRSDSDLISIFDPLMDRAYKVKERRREFLQILGAIFTGMIEEDGDLQNVA
ncbi:MAG: hypothetical protein COB14_07530 [Alphaproteobacteria bacterium]|nr:MAG: hypothetical protein COB14_07530 [Alphaproteobacteria bacterium]